MNRSKARAFTESARRYAASVPERAMPGATPAVRALCGSRQAAGWRWDPLMRELIPHDEQVRRDTRMARLLVRHLHQGVGGG